MHRHGAISVSRQLHTTLTATRRPQAQKWLGVKDAAQLLAATPEDENFAQPRPVGLGLGAKYLPHHKVRLPCGLVAQATACDLFATC